MMGAVHAQGLDPTLSILWNIAELSPLVLLLLPWLLGESTVLTPQGLFPLQSEFQRVSSLRSARGMGPEFRIQGASQPSYSRFLLCGKPRRAKN